MAVGEEGRLRRRSLRRTSSAHSAIEAGPVPADGGRQLALVEEPEGWVEEVDEEEQVANWCDTRELQDLFMVARPTWTLISVDRAVNKLNKVGITSLLELKEALEEGDINARLRRDYWTTFSKMTLRELKRCIHEGYMPRRETLTLMEKRLNKEFRRRMEQFVENQLDEREQDLEERLGRIVDRQIDEQLQGDLERRIYSRLKKQLVGDFSSLERQVCRRLDRLDELVRHLNDVVESGPVAPHAMEHETGSSWPSSQSYGPAASNRGPGPSMPISPKRRSAKGEAKEGFASSSVIPAGAFPEPTLPRKTEGLMAAHHRWAVDSDNISCVEDRSSFNAEPGDDTISEPPSSINASQSTQVHEIRAILHEIRPTLKASLKEALQEEFGSVKSQDDLTMMWYNDSKLPMTSDNGSEASFRMHLQEDGPFYEQPTEQMIRKHDNLRLDLDGDMTSVGADWEGAWSKSYNCMVYQNKKTHEMSFISPDVLPEIQTEEPEVVVSAERPVSDAQGLETPEETRSDVSPHTPDLSKAGNSKNGTGSSSEGWLSLFRK